MKYPRLPHDLKQHIKLTVRDIELVRWLYHNGRIKSIQRLASCFNTTPHTIKYWIDPLFRKTELKRRVEILRIQKQTDMNYEEKRDIWNKNSRQYHLKIDPNYREYYIDNSRKHTRILSIERKTIRGFKNFMEAVECHT